MPENIIIDRLSFRYSSKPVFNNFTAQIPLNTLLVGKNGSGKTTLLKLIAKTLMPESGSIRLDDVPHYHSAIFFNHRILFDSITIRQHIQWIVRSFQISTPSLDLENSEFLENSFLDRKPGELSEGERQWTSLMLTCLMPADIYLLDEPVRALDEAHFQLFNEFLQRQIDAGKKYMMTAHSAQNYIPALTTFQLSQNSPYIDPLLAI